MIKKIMDNVMDFVVKIYKNNNGKPWKSSWILRLKPKPLDIFEDFAFFIFLFSHFFHVSSSSSCFFFFQFSLFSSYIFQCLNVSLFQCLIFQFSLFFSFFWGEEGGNSLVNVCGAAFQGIATHSRGVLTEMRVRTRSSHRVKHSAPLVCTSWTRGCWTFQRSHKCHPQWLSRVPSGVKGNRTPPSRSRLPFRCRDKSRRVGS